MKLLEQLALTAVPESALKPSSGSHHPTHGPIFWQPANGGAGCENMSRCDIGKLCTVGGISLAPLRGAVLRRCSDTGIACWGGSYWRRWLVSALLEVVGEELKLELLEVERRVRGPWLCLRASSFRW